MPEPTDLTALRDRVTAGALALRLLTSREYLNLGEAKRLLATLAAEAVAAAEADSESDELVRCSRLHCPNGEWFRHAKARGWVAGPMGSWSCPQHAPACRCSAAPVHQLGCDAEEDGQ